MPAHHHISKLLIDERVNELRQASNAKRPDKRGQTRPRRRPFSFMRHRMSRRFSSTAS